MTPLLILSLVLVAVTMGLALAHALEFPGKRRLDEKTYRAVQAIYYPGFTIGGLIGEAGALLLLPILLLVTPFGTERFWWLATAFAGIVLTHATYWLVTHPVNSAWLEETELSEPGKTFFAARAGGDGDWKQMRDRWEYSHVARAGFAMLALVAITVALLR